MLNKNIFITGASGKIGSYLLKRLEASEYNLILLSNERVDQPFNQRVRWVNGDLLEPYSYASNLKNVNTILHMAAITHTNNVARYYEVNSKGTLDLIKLCRNYGVKRFIFVSTTAISEDGGAYSRSKLLAENHVKDSGLSWVILHVAETYGTPGGKGIDLLLRNISRLPFIPIVGTGNYLVAPVYISDVVSSLERVIKDPLINNRIYDITGPDIMTYNQLIDKIMVAKRIRRVKFHIPPFVFKFLARISSLLLKDKFLILDQLPRMLCKKSYNALSAGNELGIKPKKMDDVLNDRMYANV